MDKQRRAGRVLGLAALLTAIWYLLSGKFDLLHFGTGAVVSLLIAANYVPIADGTGFRLLRFVAYVPWLIGQILISNLRVARVVLSRRMPIAPAFIIQKPGVTGPRALTLLGSSITLTPGTLTVDVGEDEVFVHALDTASADDIRDNVIARRVAEVFPVRPR
jgi:multicomponent Na+:H+ antiporter subunit E